MRDEAADNGAKKVSSAKATVGRVADRLAAPLCSNNHDYKDLGYVHVLYGCASGVVSSHWYAVEGYSF